MKYLISISLIIIPIIISLAIQVIEKKKRKKKLIFVNIFFNKLHEYIESSGTDTNSYTYMTKNSNQMQNQLGHQGKMTVQHPFNQGVTRNYTIILTGLPQIRSYFSQSILRSQAIQLSQLVNDALLRNIGDCEKKIDEIIKKIYNPIILYKTGWEYIISVPFTILFWFGIFTKRILNSLIENILFKFITGIIALLGVISSILTIALGYNDFIKFINDFFSQ